MPDANIADSVKVPVAMATAGRYDPYTVAAVTAAPYLGLVSGNAAEVFAPDRGFYRVIRPRKPGEHNALYHEKHSAQGGTLRHQWIDRGDGVLIGYLKPTAVEVQGEPDPIAAIRTPDASILAENIRKAIAAGPDNTWLADKVG